MTALQLYTSYVLFGEDPYINSTDENARFSAWNYAKLRSEELLPEPTDPRA